MPADTTTESGDPSRAMHALERAVAAAERGAVDRPIVLASPADVAALSPADLRRELDRVMMAPHSDDGLDALLAGGVLDAILPEVRALVGFGDGEWRHKDVWKHTKQVVCQSTERLEVRWAALFHDIGKVRTRSISPEGEVHFFGHAEVGARMFEKMDRRQKLFASDDALRREIHFLVLHHLRASQYDGSWTDSAVRRFAREMGPYLEDLLCLSRADITTKRPEKKRRGISMIDQLADRITTLAAEDAVVPPLPSGVGNELMTRFGLPPSRKIGDIKRALEAAIDAGELEGHREPAYYVEYVGANPARFGLD
ncbi:MAG: HDIG domain-containing protein [Sorangiineae bacterium]|nr:HDIG domain-containing protein [Polyangiaceae bacterium]MEB2321213.1 HDIG domain-containing protein [Sorangiineae bacterium]